ncbi:kelch repeat-containing protein [Brucella cytisi]|uniref:kelch repeat-containing protein n=1 Tax=Brucella cytisi TaxID=407152 RepID=UPI00313E0BB9
MKILSRYVSGASLALALACVTPSLADDIALQWKELPSIPANARAWNDAIPVKEKYWRQIGLAGPITGVHGDYLLVGGGANFPEPGKMPNEANRLGKVYWNELFVLDLNKKSWSKKEFQLPSAIGYAATVSLPDGVLVVGGEGFRTGPDGAKLAKVEKSSGVFLMRYDPDSDEVAFKDYPALPVPSSYGAAALVGDTVYYQTGKDVYTLDLDSPDTGWKPLPAFPGEARDTALAAAVGGKFIVASGRNKQDGVWHIHDDAYAFDPANKSWEKLPDMPFPAMAGEAFGVNDRYMVIVGGDKDVDRWNVLSGLETERAKHESGTPEWEKANTALTFLADHHFGFNTEVLAYDIKTSKWEQIGSFPGAAPVTTQPVTWKGKLLLPSGEIRPGIRTPKIWMGNVTD